MLLRTSLVIIAICGKVAIAQIECPATFDEVTTSGVEPSGAIVNGSPAVAYVDSNDRDLLYATLSEKGWVSEEVFIGTALYPSLADVDGLPGIAFLSFDGVHALMYATLVNGEWQTEPIDNPGFSIEALTRVGLESIAGLPAIAFVDATGILRFTSFDGDRWITQIIDSSAQPGVTALDGLDLATVDGSAAVSYKRGNELRYARLNPLSRIWEIDTVADQSSDGSGSNNNSPGPWSSLADIDGLPAISYEERTNKRLHFARHDGTAWQLAILDAPGGVGAGEHTNIAVVNSQPAIGYRNGFNDNLKYALFDGTEWWFAIADVEAGTGFDGDLLVLDETVLGTYSGTGSSVRFTCMPFPPGWFDDTDGDGILDVEDVCPDTPQGDPADDRGRPVGDLDEDCDQDLEDYAIFQNGMMESL